MGTVLGISSLAVSLLGISSVTLWTVHEATSEGRERMASMEARIENLEKGVDRINDRLMPNILGSNE